MRITRAFDIVLFLLLNHLILSAQVVEFLEYEHHIVENFEGSESELEDYFNELDELKQNPLNINTATEEELHQLVFLNEFQIRAVLDYREKTGTIRSLNEMQYIYGFNGKTLALLKPYLSFSATAGNFISPEKNKKIVLKNQLLSRYIINSPAGSENFSGDNNQYYFRYKGELNNKLSLGILAEKDKGENYFNQPGRIEPDFYSGYMQLSQNRLINQINVGDFRVKSGQGLLIWNGYTGYKSTDGSGLLKRGALISANTSKDEYNYLRGGAVVIGNKKFKTLFYVSSKKIDGTIDTVNNQPFVSAINANGYHRTLNELNKKGSVGEKSIGLSLKYSNKFSNLGLNYLSTCYGIPLIKSEIPYKQNNFSGKSFNGFSFDYLFLFQYFQIYGETSYASDKLATISGINFMPDASIMLSLALRYYESGYFSPYCNFISESGSMENEKGLFLAVNWNSPWKITFNAYTDIAKFPWLKYVADAPSTGQESVLEIEFIPDRTFRILTRYKWEQNFKNSNESDSPVNSIEEYSKQNLRIQAMVQISDKVTMSTRLEYTKAGFAGLIKHTGYLAYQEAKVLILNTTKLFFRYTAFNIEDYDARMYIYENDLLYGFSVPMFYGRGAKFSIMINQKFGENHSFWLKYNLTHQYLAEQRNEEALKLQYIVKF